MGKDAKEKCIRCGKHPKLWYTKLCLLCDIELQRALLSNFKVPDNFYKR